MTAYLYNPCGQTLRPCELIADNHDGTFNIRPSGWTQGHVEISGTQIYTHDEVHNTKETKMTKFTRNIGDQVELALSGEKGHVIGRAEYREGPNNYFIQYVDANGRQTEAWFTEKDLKPKTAQTKTA